MAWLRQCEMLIMHLDDAQALADFAGAAVQRHGGLAAGLVEDLDVAQLMPRRQPVPIALSTASLAAQRPAKCGVASLRLWQYWISAACTRG